MSDPSPLAPLPVDVPLRVQTAVTLHDNAKLLDRDFIAGGSPWRLLRLPGASMTVARRWRDGAHVRAGEQRLARTLVQQGVVRPLFQGPLALEDIDVIIPVHDDIAPLRALLAQLRGLHVTIVDDASSDPTLLSEIARQFDATLIRLEKNLGPGGARNAGALATSRALLWFLDDDVEIDDAPEVLRRLSVQFQDPMIAACAPRIRGAHGATIRDRFEERFSPLDLGPHAGLVMPGAQVTYVPSACLVVRRTAFGEGFDETLRLGEDVDLVWRLHERGWLVRYLAEVVVTHRARTTWRTWFAQRVGYGASAGALATRHGERIAPVRSDVWTLAAWGALLARRPLIAARIVGVVRNRVKLRVAAHSDAPDVLANEVVTRGMLASAGPLARALVRTFGPGLLLLALVPRFRRQTLGVFALGTAWRFRHQRPHLGDVPLALLDDAAYCVGVAKGAIEQRSFAALTPRVIRSSVRVRDVLGLKSYPTN
jgi:mycofactocin system glycosyltransferase